MRPLDDGSLKIGFGYVEDMGRGGHGNLI